MELRQLPPRELERLVRDRVLIQIADATEADCEIPCSKEGPCRVDPNSTPPQIYCPWREVAARNVEPEDIRQYSFSLKQFIARLREANGISPEDAEMPILSAVAHAVGLWNREGRSYAVYLALGLDVQDVDPLLTVLSAAERRDLLVLSPTLALHDAKLVRRLAREGRAVWSLIDVMNEQYRLTPPGAPAGESERMLSRYILVINRPGHRISYKGLPVHLQPKRFEFFCALADQPGKIVSRSALGKLLYDDDADVYEHQLTDHKVKIIARFLTLAGKNGITRKEIEALIKTHKKVGYELNLDPEAVHME